MAYRSITPTAQLGSRPPEAGRLRMGVKTTNARGKQVPTSIDTWRLTSPDRRVIEQAAELYGGVAEKWNDSSANPPNQWQVITQSSTLDVLIIPDGLSVWYEQWVRSGVTRRCDGIVVKVPRQGSDGWELVDEPCLCEAERQRVCEPHTRLRVVLPRLAFLGVWRLETKGWNAAEELPGMADLIMSAAQQGRMVDAELSIVRAERQTMAGKRNFVIPRLAVRNTLVELSTGTAAGVLQSGAQTALPAASSPAQLSLAANPDDEIADAEVLDDELLEIEALLAADAKNFGLDPDRYVEVIKVSVKGDRMRMRACSDKVRAGALTPLGFKENRVHWKEA